MMAGTGNPTNWWSIMVNAGGTMHPPQQPPPPSPPSSSSLQLLPPPSSSSTSHHFYGASNSLDEHQHHHQQDFPRSWSQLLLGGLGGGSESEKFGMSHFQYKKMEEENWEDHHQSNPSSSSTAPPPPVVNDVIKQEHHNHQFTQIGHLYGQHNNNNLVLETHDHHQYFQNTAPPPPPPHHHHQEFASSSSSPSSCVSTTTLFRDNLNNNNSNNNNVFFFSGNHNSPRLPEVKTQHPHHLSYECNSTCTSSGGASKKARVHQSSTQPSLKVRKEKLGDRITALHQLVSPFGKTDTASVLSEAIGYIRFLHTQIQALSSPYLGNASGSMGQGHTHQQSEQENGGKDLRSRGLCLVPLSCTQHVSVGSDINGADYWAPALGGGF